MQGLPDHAHVPTLQRLPKDLPIVASPAGAQVAADLGFRNITALDHGQETIIGGGKLRIRATAGSLYCHDSCTTSISLRIATPSTAHAVPLASSGQYWVLGPVLSVLSTLVARTGAIWCH